MRTAAASARLLLLRRQPRIAFDPIAGGGAEPGLRRSDGRTMVLTGLHVQPHLAVGDVSARQALILLVTKNQMLRLTTPNARTRQSPLGKTRRRGRLTTVGLRPPFVSQPRRHSHPDCRSLLTLIVAQHGLSPRCATLRTSQTKWRPSRWRADGQTTSGNRKLVSEGGLKFSSLQAPEPAADTDCIIVQMSLCFL